MAIPNPPVTPNTSKLHYLLYDDTGTNAAAVWHSVKEITVNTEVVGVAHVGTHILATSLGASDAIVVVAGTDGGTIRALAVNADGEVGIHDGGNSITVDGTITADAGTGPWPVTDNGGSLTVDGTVGVSGTVDVGITTDDLDTGAGTDTRAVVGLVSAESGGGVLIGSANPLPVGLTSSLPAGTNNIGDVDVLTLPPLPAGTNNIGDVDVLTVPAPLSTTGGGTEATALRVTLASDSTGVIAVTQSGTWNIGTLSTITNVVHVDDNSGSLTVDGTVGVSGTVTVDSELPAAAALADATANPTVPGVGAFILGYNGTTWDRIAVANSGRLQVDVVTGGTGGDGAILDGVSGAIKATVFDYTNSNPLGVRLTDTNGDYVSVGGGTQYTEDAVAPADPVGTQLIARRRDTPATETTTDGDVTALNSTAKGELYVKHLDAIAATQSGTWDIGTLTSITNVVHIDDNSGSITVDGTVGISGTVTVSGLVDTELPAAAALADNTANPTVPGVGSFPHWFDGATWDRAPGTSADGLLVNLGANNDVVVSGTVAVSSLPALPAGTNNIGDVDVLTVPAPLSTTGGGTEATALRVTIASDSTGVLSVDDNGGSLTVDAPVGTPVNVQVGDGSNTATIRNLAANDALNVAIVDAAGDHITSFGGGTQYTEDAASAADPVGTQLIARRRDTPATETTTDGDVTALNSTAKGELYVKHLDAITANLGTIAGVATESTLSSVDTWLSNIQGDTNTLAGGVSGGTYQTAITSVTSSAGTGATNADGMSVLASGPLIAQSYPMAFNGSTWDRVRGTTAKGLQVDTSCNNGLANGAVTVTTSATALPTTPLSNRRRLVIQNNDSSVDMYIGDASVTTSTGMKIPPGWSQAIEAGPTNVIYGIVASGSINARVLELS